MHQDKNLAKLLGCFSAIETKNRYLTRISSIKIQLPAGLSRP